MKKLSFYCMVFLGLVIISSCQKDDELITEPEPDPIIFPDMPKEGVLIQTSVFGRIVDENEEPVSGVRVTGGGVTTSTDENGIYILSNVMLDEARGYIRATKSGYFNGSRILQPVKNGMSKPAIIKLLAQKSIGTINAATGGIVQSPGKIKVELPANAIEGYSGQVNVVAAYINPTSPDFFARMPGDLAADNSENKRGGLISYGMCNLDLLDNNGNKLTIKPGVQATVSSPVPQSLQQYATDKIDMWHFDESKGIWKQEGVGTYQNGQYTGKVSHFSTWNWDHWSPNMVIPIILRWILPVNNQMTPDEINNIINFMMQVRDKKTGNMLFTRMLPPVYFDTSDPNHGWIRATLPIPAITNDMVVTFQPVFPEFPMYPLPPEFPDFPNADNYTPTADEEAPIFPDWPTEDVSANYTPATPPTTLEITYPPAGQGGGTGETVVNVNGKAVDCDNKPVSRGYAFLSMRSGNTIVKSITSPIYGAEGRFTAQYIFYSALPKNIDNVVLTVYDVQTGKRSKDLKYNVNPSVAYMIPEPVKICDDPVNPVSGKVFKGDYTISNATQLKAFIDSAWTEVNGILTITGNVTDLGGIISLKRVGSLVVSQTPLQNLGGLTELEEINGSLGLYYNYELITANFPKLTNKNMEGGLYLNGNLSLTGLNLPSVENLATDVNAYISIVNHPLLKTLSIPNLKSVDKCSRIEIASTLLENLNVFSKATGTLGAWGLRIEDNDELTSVSGLSKIGITGRVTVTGNEILPSLDGINIPVDISDYVTINLNPLLNDLTAVSGKLKNAGAILISQNVKLQKINMPLLESATSISMEGNTEITAIEMSKLKQAGGMMFSGFPKLTTFKMDMLETVNGRIYINGGSSSPAVLADFDLPQLKTCQYFELWNCPSISNLDGFNNLTTVSPGTFTISNANIDGANVKLKSINGFNKLTVIDAGIYLTGTAGFTLTGPLTEIKGFQQLTTTGDFDLNGKNLVDISGFKNLTSIQGALHISQTALTGLEGFEKLASLGTDSRNGILMINDNPYLTSLKGLSSLSELHQIYFYANPALLNFEGLEKIKSVKNGINLNNNIKLTNLDGLINLEGTFNGITITNNTELVNFCGLTKLINGGGNKSSYYILNNGYNPTVQDMNDGNCSKRQ
jgi:hypothetical protein